METITYLDTHVVVWLFDGKIDEFPKEAQDQIQQSLLRISPMVDLELHYLHEIGKITTKPEEIINTLQNLIDLQVEDFSGSKIINIAKSLQWTRDPFDRIITAQAKASNSKILTKDKMIHKNYNRAVWG